jgi:DNA-binding NarL/FixJ family response regulator
MDLRLPGMTGVEATAAIRREFNQACIIVLSTYDGDEAIHRALQAGACPTKAVASSEPYTNK